MILFWTYILRLMYVFMCVNLGVVLEVNIHSIFVFKNMWKWKIIKVRLIFMDIGDTFCKFIDFMFWTYG